MTSLAELKSIEQQRIADERAAIQQAVEQRAAAKLEAERHAREQIEAAQRAEHERALAIEQAKVAAEREARLRVEAAEAAERARQQIALEQERSQQEMELRKAEVAKKRPTWMVAVTGLALALAVVLVVFTVKALAASDEANQAQIIAERDARQAEEEAAKMRAELDKMSVALADLDGKVKVAIEDVIKAEGKAATDAAAARLKKLRAEQIAQQQAMDEYRRKQELKKRLDGTKNIKICDSGAICRDTK